jgi:hypothetical protein
LSILTTAVSKSIPLYLVLFDEVLSAEPVENTTAGTIDSPYP